MVSRNRVDPWGRIIESSARGYFMGNRDFGDAWITCWLPSPGWFNGYQHRGVLQALLPGRSHRPGSRSSTVRAVPAEGLQRIYRLLEGPLRAAHRQGPAKGDGCSRGRQCRERQAAEASCRRDVRIRRQGLPGMATRCLPLVAIWLLDGRPAGGHGPHSDSDSTCHRNGPGKRIPAVGASVGAPPEG